MALLPSPLEVALFNAFDLFDHPTATRTWRRQSTRRAENQPTIVQPSYRVQDINGQGFIEVELPGVAEDNVKLDVREGTLSVSGARFAARFGGADAVKAAEGPEESGNDGDEKEQKPEVAAADAAQGEATDAALESTAKPVMKYEVEFSLPPMADVGNATAEFKNGLLRVRVPRKEPQKRAIEINQISV